MRRVLVERRHSGAVAKTPVGEPSGEVLDGDVVLVDVAERRVVAVQQVLPHSLALDRLRDRLTAPLRWENPITARQAGPTGSAGGRASGIYAPHRTFGFVPPQVLRQRYGAIAARLDREEPALVELIHRLGVRAWDITAQAMPTAARAHQQAVEASIYPCWHLGGVPWTSGIINVNNALPYHRDGGNLPKALSAMLALRRGVEGGALHLADYDVWLAVPDRSVITFSGQSVLHGVSPLRIRKGGRRFTLVWYARNSMKSCAPSYADEARRAALLAATHDHVPDEFDYKPELRGRGGHNEVVRVRGL